MAGNPRSLIEGLPGYKPILIRLEWPDMATPDMTAPDWRWLVGRLRALRRPLHVSCAQGHGRTGSALAILAHFLGAMPAKADPVAWVREVYCPDAIETGAQIHYIETVTGRDSKCKPMPAMSYTGGKTLHNEYGQPYGWQEPYRGQLKPTYESALPVRSSALDDVGGDAAPIPLSESRVKVRYCANLTKGILCPKIAREDGLLCDRHFYESQPTGKG